MVNAPKFLLILGPSGTGKSTVIRILRQLDSRFCYISPYITRKLREGETDKIFMHEAKLRQREEANEFLVVNYNYGFYYATPRAAILSAFANNHFPILDWPIERLPVMRQAFPGRLFVVYLRPPSLEVLAERLSWDGRDLNGNRYQEAAKEYVKFPLHILDELVDLVIESASSQEQQIAQAIYDAYLEFSP